MNSQQRVAKLEALLSRVHTRAAEPRPTRLVVLASAEASPVAAAAVAPVVAAAPSPIPTPKSEPPPAPPPVVAPPAAEMYSPRETPKAFEAPRPISKPEFAPLRAAPEPKVEPAAADAAVGMSGALTPPSQPIAPISASRDPMRTLTEERGELPSVSVSENDEVTMIQPSIAPHLLVKAGGTVAAREGEPSAGAGSPGAAAAKAHDHPPLVEISEPARATAEPVRPPAEPVRAQVEKAAQASTPLRAASSRPAVDSSPAPAHLSLSPSEAEQTRWTVTILSLAILAAGIVTYLLMR